MTRNEKFLNISQFHSIGKNKVGGNIALPKIAGCYIYCPDNPQIFEINIRRTFLSLSL
jgi:hypothetical protein